MKRVLLIAILMLGAIVARNVDESTGWEYDQSTAQAFYMFEAIHVDNEDLSPCIGVCQYND